MTTLIVILLLLASFGSMAVGDDDSNKKRLPAADDEPERLEEDDLTPEQLAQYQLEEGSAMQVLTSRLEVIGFKVVEGRNSHRLTDIGSVNFERTDDWYCGDCDNPLRLLWLFELALAPDKEGKAPSTRWERAGHICPRCGGINSNNRGIKRGVLSRLMSAGGNMNDLLPALAEQGADIAALAKSALADQRTIWRKQLEAIEGENRLLLTK